MKKFRNLLYFTSACLCLAACSDVPREAYFNRGDPESLLDVSSEVVTVPLASDQSLGELSDWINRDQPSRAELLCNEADALCAKARDALSLYGVEYQIMPSGENAAHLFYERVLARDCENRYIDNHINPYNFNYPTYGCSIASNMVQMVSDKHQFTSPSLLDYQDAEGAVRAYNGKYLYFNPVKAFEAGKEKFSVGTIKFGQ